MFQLITEEGEDMSYPMTPVKKVVLYTVIAGVLFIGLIFPHIKLPNVMANQLVPFKVEEPSYLPIKTSKTYSHVIGSDRVETVYENKNETITVWATTDIGWNVVSNWTEQIVLSNGIRGYYNEQDSLQMISWRKGNVEYAIDYEGENLTKEDLIEIAASFD